jgi:hypothetical protein
MPRVVSFIVLLCIVALLTLQSAGLHLHANVHTDGMQLHTEHVHDADSDGHDHSADVDVTIFELGMLWAKLALLLPSLGILVLLAPGSFRVCRYTSERPPAQRRQARWRPPLRAPPVTL